MVKLFALNAVLLVLVGLTYGQSDLNRKVCLTSECLKAAEFLKQRIDTGLNPCDNFYKFACGKWIANTEIPSQYQYTSTVMQMEDKINLNIKALLEKPHDPATEKNYIKLMKDYHAQCTNIDAIDSEGVAPLTEFLKSVGEWPHLSNQWSAETFDAVEQNVRLGEKGIYHSSYALRVDVSYIPGDILKNAVYIGVNKLHLLGASNYRKGMEDKSVKYEYEQMLKIADVLGVDKNVAAEDLKNVMELKVRVANAINSNDEKVLMSLDELSAIAPGIQWEKLIEGLTSQRILDGEKIVVNQPKNVEAVNKVMNAADKRTVANFMMYNTIAVVGEYVSKEIRNIVLDVRSLRTGIRENDLPRWKVCLMDKADIMDIALSSLYVINNNFPSKRAEVIKLFETLKETFAKQIESFDLFDEEAAKVAVKKIQSIQGYLLHPDEYLNQDIIQQYYGELNFDKATTLLSKRLVLSHLEVQKMYRRLREKNHNKWEDFKYALKVESDYNSEKNIIRMTEGLFNWPVFSEGRPNYLNYGSAGFVMGHEIIQPVDTEGKYFDENGKPWTWNPETEQKYNKKAECFVKKYNKFIVNGVNVNGTRTLNENIADDFGMALAYMAYKEATKNANEEAVLPGLSYSPDQLFWISSANVICAKFRDEYMIDYVKTDRHSPAEIRANGAVMNSKTFAQIFQCPENSPMNPTEKC